MLKLNSPRRVSEPCGATEITFSLLRGRFLTRAFRNTLGTLVLTGVLLGLGLTLWLGWQRTHSTAKALSPALQGQAALDQLKKQGQYDSLTQAIEATHYSVKQTPRAGEYTAANPAQGYHTTFKPTGVELAAPGGGDWRLAMQLRSVGYGKQLQPVSEAALSANGTRVELCRTLAPPSAIRHPPSTITEWYENRPAGLEQGFTLSTSPGQRQPGERLELALVVGAGWRTELQADGQAAAFVHAASGTRLQYDHLMVTDAAGRQLATRMVAAGDELRLEVEDARATYPVTIDPTFTQQAYLKASNTNVSDQFGYAVAISGDTIVVATPFEDSIATGINGNEADNSASLSGAAYVFVRSGTTWSQQAYLKASNTQAGDQFGVSVAISGDTIVVGASQEDSNATGVNGNQADNSVGNSGAAYVFVRSGTTWSQQAYLKASNTGVNDGFGGAVGVSGDTIVVGAPGEGSSATGVNGSQTNTSTISYGAAYVFVRSGTTWGQQAYLKASNTGADDQFGLSVSVSGDTVVVGTDLEDSNATGVNGNQADNSTADAGAAYVFVRSGTTWSQQAYLKASVSGAGIHFGNPVAISGDTVVAGAYADSGSGAAYVFFRNGTTWSQQAKLTASNAQASDQFGSCVAISGDTLVVAANGEDSNATGVNGNQADNSASGSGAAYVFTRSGTAWSQQAYLKASNTQTNDFFGQSVGVSGDTVVVGANGEDSNATGINGNQADNSLSSAGAVYVFTAPPSCTGGLVTYPVSAYLQAHDSPFVGTNFSYFHLEDFTDGLLNTPGLSINAGAVGDEGPVSDSVDADGGCLDGNGNTGRSWYSGFGVHSMTFQFDKTALGNYPTHVGLVYTDIPAVVQLEFFDPLGASLGTVSFDFTTLPWTNGATDFDRFMGASSGCGISKMVLTTSGGGSNSGFEVDHIQYGLANPAGTLYSPVVVGACVTNQPPLCNGATISRQQGTAGSTATIATVSDDLTPAGSIAVTATTVPAGITITGLVNSGGTVMATVAAGCNAALGNNTVVLTATDGNGATATANVIVNVTANNAPTLTYTTPQSVTAGASLNITPTAATDNGSIATFAVQSVTPPLTTPPTVNSAGVVSVTAAGASGMHDLVIRATDNCGLPTDFTIQLSVVCQSITVTAPATNSGTANAAFSATFTQSGGIGTTNFSTTDALPAGIILSSGGVLSGTPTQTGTFPIMVKATDSNGCMGTANYTLTIGCQTITVTNPGANTGTTGAPFNQTFTQAGGIGTTTFSTASVLPTGLSLSTAGGLSGTPTQIGTFPIVIKATDANGCMGVTNYTLTIVCPTITLSTLPGGTSGATYNQTLAASPAGGNYGFSVASGSLPPGLSLAANGTLTGTPSLAGVFTFTIQATGFGSCVGTREYTLAITCPTVSVNPATLPNATINTAYSQSLSSAPAGTNYSFVFERGVLPDGVTLQSNGTLSGTPTQAGTFNFRVVATGFGSCSGFRDYVLTVDCVTITLTPSSLPAGTLGTAYSTSVSATPAGSYIYVAISGALPAGLTLNATNGALTGTPTQTGTFNFRVTAVGGGGLCRGFGDYTITVSCGGPTTLGALTNGAVGASYSGSVAASPAGTYSYSVISGSLPSGLTLNAATGAVTGVLAISGTYSFSIRAQATGGCSATQSYTLAVNCPAVTVNPATLPPGATGTAYSQTFTASPAGGNYTFAASGSLPPGFNLNPSTGVLSGTPSASGSFPFTITASGFGGCIGSRQYTLIVSGSSCPTITLPGSLPNGNVGTLYTNSVGASPVGGYTYSATGTLPPGVTLFGSFGLIFGYPAAAGSYTFTVTATLGACTSSQQYTVLIGTGSASSLTVFSDFDGDGKSDLSVFRGSDGNWLVANSGNGQLQSTAWGAGYAPYNDLAVSGDYDGDAKTDQAVFRRGGGQDGYWYINRSSDGQIQRQFWGLATDVPVPGDYDGDGRTDIAVWRGSSGAWYILRSSDGAVQGALWGLASVGDLPVPGDYDGDGKTDLAVFRRTGEQAGHWFIKRSSDGQTHNVEWGLGTDVPVAADFDGDGKTDLAVWRGLEGNWYILQSGNALTLTVPLGRASQGEVPAPGDYDGDGKADAAVWQESSGTWTVKRSSDAVVVSKVHGQSGDAPVTARRN